MNAPPDAICDMCTKGIGPNKPGELCNKRYYPEPVWVHTDCLKQYRTERAAKEAVERRAKITKTCHYCGISIIATSKNGPFENPEGNRHPPIYGCDDCLEKARERRNAERLVQAKDRYRSGLPELLKQRTCSLPDPELWPWAYVGTDAFKAKVPSARLRAVAEKWTGRSVLLLGESGGGKTSTAIALVRRLESDCIKSNLDSIPEEYENLISRGYELGVLEWFKWTTGHNLGYARRNDSLGSATQLIENCKTATLLIVDEVGTEPIADHVLFEVVDARYARQLPTIVTSGCTRQQFAARYGDALFRRLTQPEVGKLIDEYPKETTGSGLRAVK